MKIKILLITHENIGAALLKTAKRTFGQLPLTTTVVAVQYNSDPKDVIEKLKLIVAETYSREGILILTDMYGSTPCNIALALREYKHIHVVSGLNLPMLVKVLNYAHLPLHKLVHKAIQGGRDGVVSCTREYRKLCENQLDE